MSKLLALIRVKGTVKKSEQIERTLSMLNLPKNNNCSLAVNSSEYLGMIKKVKDLITWGEIDKETLKLLIEKRGFTVSNKKIDAKKLDEITDSIFSLKSKLSDHKIKRTFRLHPPKKGHKRAGIKKPFTVGGALGYRKEKINDLIKQMV